TMIKVLDHLGLVQWHVIRKRFSLKQARVGRHVEHSHERNSPEVRLRWSFAHEDWNRAVNVLADLGVIVRPKDRARERVGVNESDVAISQREVATNVSEIFNRVSEENEIAGLDGTGRSRKSQQTELEASVPYTWEDILDVLEIVQAHK